MKDKEYLKSTEFYDHKFKNFSTLIIIPSFLFLLVILLFLFFTKKENVISTTGQIQPLHPIVTVPMSNKEIINNNLGEGKTINKGDTLSTYNNKLLRVTSNGIIHLRNKPFSKNDLSRKILIQIYPVISGQENIKVRFKVSPNVIGEIKRNQKMKFFVSSKPSEQLTINGKIQSVDIVPTSTKDGDFFYAEAIVKNKRNNELYYGEKGRVSIILGKEKYIDYLIEKIFYK
jgi:hypothetical protein